MSTNYYWIHNIPNEITIKATGESLEYYVDCMSTLIHIGKKSNRFTWCQEPEKVKLICRDNLDTKIIYNEYREELTGSEFLKIVSNIEYSLELLGRYFC